MLYREWDENEFPIAYLITIRTYGTWLHGDGRGSVDRHGRNLYGTPRLATNPALEKIMRAEMKAQPFILNAAQRIAVHREIENVCDRRSYYLRALNVRTNHLHSVASAARKPEGIIIGLKANATRALREQGLVLPETEVWSRGGSRRYLWTPRSVELAIDYTLNQQGENLVDFDTWLKSRGESLDQGTRQKPDR
jgi:hypothetical protein